MESASENLPVTFEREIHRPVEVGYERAEQRAVVIDALGDGLAVFAKSVLDGLWQR